MGILLPVFLQSDIELIDRRIESGYVQQKGDLI
ncbi:hypothetical protein M2192_001622 [Bradyrhizobium elkanii USDA 61]|uniref:Uncharacterized protein n=1 Tax=Bradyrhizobium elkanii TaxID=29448 RepID=A0A8I1YEI7_BRAEL|nr:hypothetical protein [Bradyrhizobium elkanii]MCP1932088.1 hypothetical protein [Bradyrhizobium elkanii]MCS3577369.1 hypothetical protein [Bradyrhizobium elkanii]MCS3720245.1 hypothetical protein [Bradyrhizobium elkanii]MCS4004662.1 hypothetical protein [Bradyrhizobium elkanii USDA 61]